MKKALIAATIASSILGSGIYTSQAHADEQKQPIYVFTEKEFNEHKTGATEGFGVDLVLVLLKCMGMKHIKSISTELKREKH